MKQKNDKMNSKGKMPQSEITPQKKSALENKKTPKLFYFILVLLPVLFFTLLEVALRLFNYGMDTRQWVPMPGDRLMLNPDIAYRYFYSTTNIPYSNDDLFDRIKAKNSFRIFVLGESSTAGYPYLPVGSFPRYLQTRLQLLYPDSKIEVVNAAMTAINTYALRDMFPGIIEQKPDLVLIYTGHNEYYGALGVGSVESLGSSTGLVNLILYLNKYKTVELIRNIISGVMKIFSRTQQNSSGTLMSRIVRDQQIIHGDKKYKQGLDQFKNNLHDILLMAKDVNIPVIIGTLTSNLKDQPPFISLESGGIPGAMKVFNMAGTELAKGNKTEATKLFRRAKDFDCLRFRASEDLNEIIRVQAKEFNYGVIEIDSAFNAISPDGIVGNNLMTDHLHPTLSGYQLMAKLFFNGMQKSGVLPKSKQASYSDTDKLVTEVYKLSRLDSLIAVNRVILLKNDWPFITDERNKKPVEKLINPKDYIDSLAKDVVLVNFSWEKAHRKAAQWYLEKGNLIEFQNYMDVMIQQYPIITEYYHFAATNLIKRKLYNEAYKYLQQGYKIKQDPYFAKWLGIINLNNRKTDEAIHYLQISIESDSRDPQVLFNLAGAYVYKNDYKKALEYVNRCLKIDPEFPGAAGLRNQLLTAIG